MQRFNQTIGPEGREGDAGVELAVCMYTTFLIKTCEPKRRWAAAI